jgi:hypothetical protein
MPHPDPTKTSDRALARVKRRFGWRREAGRSDDKKGIHPKTREGCLALRRSNSVMHREGLYPASATMRDPKKAVFPPRYVSILTNEFEDCRGM